MQKTCLNDTMGVGDGFVVLQLEVDSMLDKSWGDRANLHQVIEGSNVPACTVGSS